MSVLKNKSPNERKVNTFLKGTSQNELNSNITQKKDLKIKSIPNEVYVLAK